MSNQKVFDESAFEADSAKENRKVKDSVLLFMARYLLSLEVFGMNITYQEVISVEDYNILREAVGWGSLCDEQAQQGLDHSAYVIGCYDNDKIVDTARIIWDKGYISYLADVMVMPEYQRMGIGRHMVEMAIAFMKSQVKEGWKIKMVLIAAKGKEAFYSRFGFQERPNRDAGAGMDMWLT